MLRDTEPPLQRQIGESLLIEKRGITADNLVNQKGEWNGSRVPRLRINSIENKECSREEEENSDSIKISDIERRRKVRKEGCMSEGQKRNNPSDISEERTAKKRRVE